MDIFALIQIFGVPVLMLVLFGYLAASCLRKVRDGSYSKGKGIALFVLCLVPSAICTLIIAIMIGLYTGAISFM